MQYSFLTLSTSERDKFRTILAFIEDRMQERDTIEWALELNPTKVIARTAVVDAIDSANRNQMPEPWITAWRMIEYCWTHQNIGADHDTLEVRLRNRLKKGERSHSLARELSELVAPRLNVENRRKRQSLYGRPVGKPKRVKDLFSVTLTSTALIDLQRLGLAELQDIEFLSELANALEGTLNNGLRLARWAGWKENEGGHYRLNVDRVDYVAENLVDDEEQDPDRYSRGLAPVTKFTFEVVRRIAAMAPNNAIGIASHWLSFSDPLHTRLWAALARKTKLFSSHELFAFFSNLDEDAFWNSNAYPEIAELRAKAFTDLNEDHREKLTSRLLASPKASFFGRRGLTPEERERYRVTYALRELRRIELNDSVLPQRAAEWITMKLLEFPEFGDMEKNDGLPGSITVRWRSPNPDDRFSDLQGVERLDALEGALGSAERAWGDDPGSRAADWLRGERRSDNVLRELAEQGPAARKYPRLIERIGWANGRPATDFEPEQYAEIARLGVKFILTLSNEVALKAIGGLSNWVSVWGKDLADIDREGRVWFKLWPLAVEATNKAPLSEEDDDIDVVSPLDSVVLSDSDDSEPLDLDTLNTPAGKLVGLFLDYCPNLNQSEIAFNERSVEFNIRNTMITAEGRSGLIARFRLVEALPYFMRADRTWAETYLIAPLKGDGIEALTLWRAVSHRQRFADSLKVIGEELCEKIISRRLDRESRRRLVESLVIDCMFSLLRERPPSVNIQKVQQALRLTDDETRAAAARWVPLFVERTTRADKASDLVETSEERFDRAAKPFLSSVWPQERSLSTPNVSSAFAGLPAVSGNRFVAAVRAVEPFLVPFKAWSLDDYNLHTRRDDPVSPLDIVDTPGKAEALIDLLDATIGTAEDAIVPYQLSNALDTVMRVAPKLASTAKFRRLLSLTRG